MNFERTIGLGLLLLAVTPVFGQLPEDRKRRFEEAERRMLRLPPAAFPELPANVTRELQRRGCTVPQEAFTKKPHNVIKGEFAKPGQTDWAVLCSVQGVSSILVFWNGSAENPAALAATEDRNYLQGISAEEIGFSRGIAPVGKEFIMRHYKAYGGPTPPPIDHQGIDDSYIEKASVTWYFYARKWVKLTGAD
jgi:hypothetical protein